MILLPKFAFLGVSIAFRSAVCVSCVLDAGYTFPAFSSATLSIASFSSPS